MEKSKVEELYNRDNFLEVKDSLVLGDKDISEIVGLSFGTVKNSLTPSQNNMNPWMRVFIYMYNRQKELEAELKETEAFNLKLLNDNRRSFKNKAKENA